MCYVEFETTGVSETEFVEWDDWTRIGSDLGESDLGCGGGG